MSLVTLKEILSPAKNGGYAVPAFNVYNMETVMGAVPRPKSLVLPSYCNAMPGFSRRALRSIWRPLSRRRQ